jgi:nitrogen fixation protein FixH
MKSGMQWPIGIAIVLSVTVVANLVVMRIANSDPSFAVEPDYYQKAVDFDSTRAHENASAQLGWMSTTTITFDEHTDTAWVTVILHDATHTAVEHAVVAVDALPVARANDVLHATLSETTPGVYRAPLPVPRGGLWDVHVNATRDTARYLTTTRVEIATPRRRAASATADTIVR